MGYIPQNTIVVSIYFPLSLYNPTIYTIYWDYIGTMERKRETTIVYWVYTVRLETYAFHFCLAVAQPACPLALPRQHGKWRLGFSFLHKRALGCTQVVP